MENFRSPGFTKPGADQCLDPPALLTATDAPQALGVVGDFSARSAEEAPLLTVLQISTSSLCFWGAEPPVFRRIFALCPAFQRWVGYLPYPRGKSGTQGRQRLLLFFTVVGGMCCKCVFSYTSKFRRNRNGFSDLQSDAFQIHIRDRKMYFRCRLRLCHTFATEK